MLTLATLCHLGVNSVPDEVIESQTWESCFISLIVTIATTLPAVHKRHSNVTKQELSALLEEVPSFKPWNAFIQACIFISSLNTGLGGFISGAKLAETVDKKLVGLSYEWYMIVVV